jgi:glycosyltransferase involved in cell wall biosynthesis
MSFQNDPKLYKKIKLGMVSIYPPLGSRHCDYGAVAAYSKSLVESLDKASLDITVYANSISDVFEIYEEGGVLVKRCWSKGALYPFQIALRILKDNPNIIHLQHEFFLYGGVLSSLIFPLLLIFLRFKKAAVVVTLHGIFSLKNINKDFIKNNGIKFNCPLLIKTAIFGLVKLICLSSEKIIVHENKFSMLLINEYGCPSRKLKVIPIGIEEQKLLVNKQPAKVKLGLSGKKIVLYFGYLAPYKGIEVLLDAFRLLAKKHLDYVLLLCGGEHPRLKNKPDYQRYLSNLKSQADKISDSQARFIGFVPEEMMPVFFSAADIAVFPYSIGMAASSALSIAISYNRPFIVSYAFGDLASGEESIYLGDYSTLAEKLEHALEDEAVLNRLTSRTEELKKERSVSNIAEITGQFYKKELI